MDIFSWDKLVNVLVLGLRDLINLCEKLDEPVNECILKNSRKSDRKCKSYSKNYEIYQIAVIKKGKSGSINYNFPKLNRKRLA
jgi:hypothetical protein